MATKTLYTAQDLLQMPDDEREVELVKGELICMTPTGGRHGKITIRISTPLDNYVMSHNLGVVCGAETGFKLQQNPDTVRAPDVSFVSRERIPEEGEPDDYWPFAPDLAVEVISPGDRYEQVKEKVKDYLEAGTSMVWVADPKTRTITVYRSWRQVYELTESDTLSGEEVVPGYGCPVADIFG